jgi:hypothetical protein
MDARASPQMRIASVLLQGIPIQLLAVVATSGAKCPIVGPSWWVALKFSPLLLFGFWSILQHRRGPSDRHYRALTALLAYCPLVLLPLNVLVQNEAGPSSLGPFVVLVAANASAAIATRRIRSLPWMLVEATLLFVGFFAAEYTALWLLHGSEC